VVLVAVGLDDHALLAPEEVHADRQSPVREIEPLLDLGRGQGAPAAERKKALLDLALGRGGADVVLLE
jgi:hypothetical protein